MSDSVFPITIFDWNYYSEYINIHMYMYTNIISEYKGIQKRYKGSYNVADVN